MNNIDRILDVYEANQARLVIALERAGGSLPTLMNEPLREVLRTLAKNNVRLDATYIDPQQPTAPREE